MPVNCPLAFASCDDCPKLGVGQCNWHFPPMPLAELLTPGERIDALEKRLAKAEMIVPSYVLAELRKDVNNIQGMLLHFQKQFNEHIAPDKRKKFQKMKKETEGGTSEV